MTRSPARGVLSVAALCLLIATPLFSQARKLKRIKRPAPTVEQKAARGDLPPLPDHSLCEARVREIAKSYGAGDIAHFLAADFPNRGEFLDALERARQRATSIELLIESIESTRYTTWKKEEPPTGATAAVSTVCIAEVRTRLVFDDAETGERTVSNPSRTEWQIRFVYAKGIGGGQ